MNSDSQEDSRRWLVMNEAKRLLFNGRSSDLGRACNDCDNREALLDLLESSCLTQAEKDVMNQTADLWNAFVALPKQHPSDAVEFALALHAIQHLVMIRPSRRLHPEVFYCEEGKLGEGNDTPMAPPGEYKP